MRGGRTWLVMLGGAAIGAPAMAQSAPAETPPPAAPAVSALDDIVVTARRRLESLQDVPASIGVLNSAGLDQRGIASLDDMAQSAAGLAIETSGGIGTVFIRGVGGGGRNIGFGTRAGIYVDGVYVGQFASINQSTSDIDRVEILRGPQGTLFGRNSVAGAINVVTRQPGYTLAAAATLEGGDHGDRKARASVNLPIADQQLALRLSGALARRHGFTTNVLNGQDLDNIDRKSARGQLRWDAAPALTITLAGDYNEDNGRRLIGEDETNLTGTGPSALPGRFDVAFSTTPVWESKFYGASGTIEYRLPGGATLTAISALRKLDWARANDLDYSPLDLLSTDYNDKFRQFSQEVRLASGGDGPVSYVAGLYYLNDRARTDRAVLFGSQIGALPFGLQPGRSVTVDAAVTTRSFAAFGNADVRLANGLTLNLGLRFTDESVRLAHYDLDGSAAPALNIATVAGLTDKVSTSRLDPTVALTYAVAADVNLYVKYSRGFKSGGFNIDFLNSSQVQDGIRFAAETANNYEAGIKSELFDRRARVNLSVYRTDFQNYQINQFVDLGNGQTVVQLRNAATVHIRGAELEALAEPVAGLTLGANLAYVDATFKSFPNGGGPGVDLDGARLPQAPRFTGAFFGGFRATLSDGGVSLTGFAEYSQRGRSFSGAENLARQALDRRHLLNLRLGIEGPGAHWAIEGWVENALNDKYTVNRDRDFFGTLFRNWGAPRTIGATLRLAF
ncbi:TonB-dependent receptor [Sphingomonas flavalba]|uniref:TonB-dependent receptor n=1 Tax=Sphingomonas flavalba TaxID=2559804 RepID=UPI0039E15389